MNAGWRGTPIPTGILWGGTAPTPWGGTAPILLNIAGCWLGRGCCWCCCGGMYMPPGTPYIWGWLPCVFGAYSAIILSVKKSTKMIKCNCNPVKSPQSHHYITCWHTGLINSLTVWVGDKAKDTITLSPLILIFRPTSHTENTLICC